MKAMTKTELARAAGVSARTFTRWIRHSRKKLELMGISPNAHLIPPVGVKFLVEKYCIDLCEEPQKKHR